MTKCDVELVEDIAMYICIIWSLISWPSQDQIWIMYLEWWVNLCKLHISYYKSVILVTCNLVTKTTYRFGTIGGWMKTHYGDLVLGTFGFSIVVHTI
jgi:hypothetical protein